MLSSGYKENHRLNDEGVDLYYSGEKGVANRFKLSSAVADKRRAGSGASSATDLSGERMRQLFGSSM